ncbi:PASTA domain-containing protein [bacterium]|nr:PASTA domain-containing protein [bacterium]MBU1073322.1 PASTA domain-containing protein [bacterium]MBU1674700.1 PASTA domain-containing protein [bacterium]
MKRGVRRPRIRWLQLLILLPFLVLTVRLVIVQVCRHEAYLERAERQWKHRESIPATRGNLYDRHGRSLALSLSTWRLGISTCLVEDADSTAAHVSGILGLDPRGLAARIEAARPDHLILERSAVVHLDTLVALCRHKEVTHEELRTRAYPLGGIGASLLGFCREDPQGRRLTTGLEQALDDVLAGTPGEGLVFANVTGGSDGRKELVRPLDGLDVVLSIDADLQAIAEACLVEQVAECNAAGGAVVIVDPHSGDILAAADTPIMADRARTALPGAWDNFCFTGAYEPGSVMKIFTAASLLQHAVIDTTTAYDCDDIQFDGYKIRNSESRDFGVLSFTGAFSHSINVYFARAVLNLRRSEFHRDLVEFGFGAPCGLKYPGRTRGSLKPPESWSGRSLSTLAIGQEMTCTPIQLALAAAAVANGGELMAPRLVKEIRSKDGTRSEAFPPVVQHRVMTPDLAALLRGALAQAVREGTGRLAAVAWTEVAGKTGTAQKALPGQGYVDGLYMSSFLGMAPASSPRLVILTLLDEADYAHHYASQSAAPLFASIVEEIGRATDWFSGVDARAGAVAERRDGSEAHQAPDLLYLSTLAAREEVARVGLNLSGAHSDGVVVAQSPSPGTLCPREGSIRVTIAPYSRASVATGVACPDLRGMSSRQIRRAAARLGLPLVTDGVGYVIDQEPAPGEPVGADGINVRLAARW